MTPRPLGRRAFFQECMAYGHRDTESVGLQVAYMAPVVMRFA